MDTLNQYEPVALKLNDVQKAIDIIRQQQVDNMRLSMHPMLPFGFKVMDIKHIVHVDSSA